MDSASERGAESEHSGIELVRNCNTGPSAQHLDGENSGGRSSPFDPFAYDVCQGKLGLGDWSCTYNILDEYLAFVARSAGEPPVSDAGIDAGPDYHV